MEEVFLKLLSMSLTAGILVIAVLVLRLLLKKAPKALVVVMWALVGIRLVCPVTLESEFSLLPDVEKVAQGITETVPPVLAEPEDWDRTEPGADAGEVVPLPDTFDDEVLSEMPVVGEPEPSTPIVEETPSASPEIYEDTTETDKTWIMQAVSVAAKVWLCGLIAMLCYGIFSYVRIYRKVRESAPLPNYKNVRVCDAIDTPFILGVIRPRIYLPSDFTEPDFGYVLEHEQAHLKRLDHIWKPLGFVLLSVYWFHPVLWLAYVLLCRDIESACDEKVVKKLGMECKKSYSTALINCSVPRKWIAACPLAFGEVGVKKRIKSILHYKKPAFWLILVAVAACIWLAVSFLTDPKGKEEEETKREVTLVVGNDYAAYLDEEGKLHVVYDEAGVTEGVDFNKTYQGLGTDRTRLVTIDEEGKLWVSYPYTVEEVEAQISESVEDATENGGNYGLGGPQPHIMRGFAELSEVRQIFSEYPYGNYVALLADGTVVSDTGTVQEALQGVVQLARDVNGTRVGLMEDGTLVIPEMGDLLRKKKLSEWPEKLAQICAGDYFVGLKEDGTVIAEDTELNYLINDIRNWSGITKLATAGGTVVGIKEDGTVVAVCKNGTDKGQCVVEDWTDIVAIDTNGSVTVGVKADGRVVTTKETDTSSPGIEYIGAALPERYDYEEVKAVFSEYLNHQAWLYPNAYPQKAYECTFEVYCTADSYAKRVFLKTEYQGDVRWVKAEPEQYFKEGTPLHILAQKNERMNASEENGELSYLGTDSIPVPAPTKPEYVEPTESLASVQGTAESISDILRENGYSDDLKLEVWLSAFDMEKKLYPYVYFIINETEVFETSCSDTDGLYRMFYLANFSEDTTIEYGTGFREVFDGRSIKPLDSVDSVQFGRVKECAALHYVYQPDTTRKLTIAGETVSIPKQNVTVNEELGVGIAFVHQYTQSSTSHYTIYRSEDGGNSWFTVAEDFTATAGDIATILIPKRDTVVCYFALNGVTIQSSCSVSEDGGATWYTPPQATKPNADLTNATIGSSVVFGSYEQDGDFSDGKEPLEWIVLDRSGDKALLLTKYGIETMVYDKEKQSADGETNELYDLLNRTIFEEAFSAAERAAIDRGKVFLLETDDVLYGKSQNENAFFRNAEARITVPTAYAAQKGAWLDANGKWAGVTASWLLTVTGTTDGDIAEIERAKVARDGTVSFAEEEIKTEYVTIRPAIWLDLSMIE